MKTNGEGVPIVAVDIDGTLGDYHAWFLKYASEIYFGRPMPDPLTINPGMRLHRFMGLPLVEYRACKLAFRQGAMKRAMPVYPYAAELTRDVRKAGGQVWICTTRPYLRLDNIDPDTQEWLNRNGIKFDAIIYGEDKYRELKRQAGKRVAAVIEDLPELWMQAARRFPDARVLLRHQPYNTHIETPDRVGNLEYAAKEIVRAIEHWREQNGTGTGK